MCELVAQDLVQRLVVCINFGTGWGWGAALLCVVHFSRSQHTPGELLRGHPGAPFPLTSPHAWRDERRRVLNFGIESEGPGARDSEERREEKREMTL